VSAPPVAGRTSALTPGPLLASPPHEPLPPRRPASAFVPRPPAEASAGAAAAGIWRPQGHAARRGPTAVRWSGTPGVAARRPTSGYDPHGRGSESLRGYQIGQLLLTGGLSPSLGQFLGRFAPAAAEDRRRPDRHPGSGDARATGHPEIAAGAAR